MSDLYSISICISTFNRKPLLKQTLEWLLKEVDLTDIKYEVIVTNDGTEKLDDLATEFAAYPIVFVKNKRGQGLAAGRNNGVDHASYDLIHILDDDILLSKHFYRRVFEVHSEYKRIILGFDRIYPEHLVKEAVKTPFGRYKLKYEYRWREGVKEWKLTDTLRRVDMLAGFSITFTKEIYNEVGPFNENFEFAGCDDGEFFYRARKKGIELVLDTSSICFHNELDNFELHRWLQRQSTGIKSAIVMCLLHPEGKQHPTWYTNMPLSLKDAWAVKLLKLKKIFCSVKPIEAMIMLFVRLAEKFRLPDSLLFRLYNALWLGHTYRAFRKAYKELIERKKGTLR